jgi:hypothetical protein
VDILIVEWVAAATATLSAAGGGALWVRNRGNRQREAIAAQLAASTAAEAFVAAWDEARLGTPALLERLGPQDSAAFGGHANVTLSQAQAVHDAYMTLVAGDNPAHKHPRKVYIRLANRYDRQGRRFRQMQQELTMLAAQCKQLTDEADSVREIRANASKVIGGAQVALAARAEEGWIVTSFENVLGDAETLFRQADEAMNVFELLTARGMFEKARLQASSAANGVRELPQRRRRLEQKANMFGQQHTALGYDFERADAGITAVQGVYAETVLVGPKANIAAAVMRHSHMERLVAELRELLNPALDAWNRAESITAQLAEIVEEINWVCREAIELRTTLDRRMATIREHAAKLRSDITDLSMESRRRDGHQKAIRKALKQLDVEVVEFIRSLDSPMPDPNRLNTRYNELADLLSRLENASCRLDEDNDIDDDDEDGDDFLPIAVTGAATAIGISLLDD